MMAKITIKDWRVKTEMVIRAVVQESLQSLVDEVQTPRAKGGRMPVDTGFLINSGHAALNSMPAGESVQPEGYRNTDYDAAPVLLVINRFQPGDRFVFGWTANYARSMEARYAFMRMAAQNWTQIVDRAAKTVEGQIK